MTKEEIISEATTPEKTAALREKLLQESIDDIIKNGSSLSDYQKEQLGFTIDRIISEALKN